MDEKNYQITDEEITANNVKSAADHITDTNVRNNKNIFDRLPELIVKRFNDFVAEVVQALANRYTKEETMAEITKAEFNSGSGNMHTEAYGGSDANTVRNSDALGGEPAANYLLKESFEFDAETGTLNITL